MLLLEELSKLTDDCDQKEIVHFEKEKSLAQPTMGRRKAGTPQKMKDQMNNIFFSKMLNLN